jgi:hypothetical protein
MLKKLKESSQCLDTLLLLATYFHANKYEKIVEFVQKTSQLQSISKLNNLELSDFVKELIPLSYLAREILKSNSKDDYVLLCVYQLLNGKLFRKMEIDVSGWVWNVLLNENHKISLIVPIVTSLVEK